MPRAVDLDQFAKAIPTVARLMYRPHPLPAILPQPGRHHPLSDRLAAKMDAVQLRELLARKRRPKVRIALTDDANHFCPQTPRIGSVARFPASARCKGSGAALPKRLRQPKHLTTAESHQGRCL